MLSPAIPRIVPFAIVTLTLVFLPFTANAGDLSSVKLALHAEAVVGKDPCGASAPSGFGCSFYNYPGDLTTQWPADGTPANVYIVALDIPATVGLAGASFGIAYSGAAFPVSWQKCGDLAFPLPGWPASGTGVVVTFGTCQDTVDPTDPEGDAFAILGYIRMGAYADGAAYIVERPTTPPEMTVADCTAAESYVNERWCQGKIGFGADHGWNPCFPCPDPVTTSTWGAVKKTMASQP